MKNISRYIIFMVLVLSAIHISTSRSLSQEIEPINVLSIAGDTIQLPPDSSYIDYLILYNAYSCNDCFELVVDNLLVRDSSARIAVLVRAGKSVLKRRLMLNEAKKAINLDCDYFFDCRDGEAEDPWPPQNLQGGIFGYYDTSRTPALLTFEQNKVRYYSYEELLETPSDTNH